MGEFDDLIGEFLIEAFEHLEQLEKGLQSLERQPSDRDALTSIFRSLHTIKGNCGFLAFGQLESVTHAGEHLLSILRDHSLETPQNSLNLLLELSDSVRVALKIIEKDNNDSTYQADDLILRLNAQATELLANLHPNKAPQPPSSPSQNPPSPEPTTQELTARQPIPESNFGSFPNPSLEPKRTIQTPPSETLQGNRQQTEVEIPSPKPPLISEKDDQPDQSSLSSNDEPKKKPPEASPKQSTSILYSSEEIRRSLLLNSSALDKAASDQAQQNDTEESQSNAMEFSVRVDTSLLDEIMNLVGELVLTRNQLQQYAVNLGDPKIESLTSQLNLITSQLQDHAIKTRMQPIEKLLGKFPRLVRQVSRLCNKAANLQLEGMETELDRSLLETIRDPLAHVVRNAIDHGLELPDERLQLGKPRHGTIRIKAFHQDGQVCIEVSDDGRGIDPAKIRAKALSLGLLSEEEVSGFSETEAVCLVFLPGLTTSSEVTRVSGRGVGMDVVKSNIENLGGKVQIATQLGEWTRLTVSIPLTLAIISALIVDIQDQDFAIPQIDLVELVRFSEDSDLSLETVDETVFFRLRSQMLPLIDLRQELHPGKDFPERTTRMRIAVLRHHDQEFGVVVDGVSDYQEIVIKPLSSLLAPLDLFSGSTILDDGSVALIFDVQGLAKRAGLKPKLTSPAATPTTDLSQHDFVSMLIFRIGQSWLLAVPVASIGRLEEFEHSSIQAIDQQSVVNYNGQVVPLLHMSQIFTESDPQATLKTQDSNPQTASKASLLGPDSESPGGEKTVQVIMCVTEEKFLGLVVDEIVDLVESRLELQTRTEKHGIYASAILNHQIVDIVDLNEVVKLAKVQLLTKPGEGQLRL